MQGTKYYSQQGVDSYCLKLIKKKEKGRYNPISNNRPEKAKEATSGATHDSEGE